MGVLKVIAGPNRGLVHQIEDRPVTIGRAHDNDISLDDPSASSLHARIVETPGGEGRTLEDLGSRNGTFLNSRRVDRVPLVFGDTIRIGVSEIAYEESLERFALEGAAAGQDSSLVLQSSNTENAEIVWETDSHTLRTLEIEGRENENPAEMDLEVVFEVIRQCNATLTRVEILDRVLGILVRKFSAERGFVMLIDPLPDGRYQEQVAAVHNRAPDGKIAIASTIVDRVVQTKSPVLSFDAMRDARFSHSDSVVQQNLKAVLCAPILREGEVIGLVHLDSHNASGLFGRKDLELLKIVCDEVALSLENAKLYGELKRMAGHNEAVLESLSDALLVVDNDLVLTTVNPRAAEVFHLAARESTGRRASEIPALAEVADLLDRSLKAGTHFEADDLEAQVPPGLARPIRVSTSILREKGGEVRGAIAVVRDLTDERELVQRVNRSERLAAMGEAVAGVAHELRNPLTVMRGLTQLIQKRLVEDDQGQEYAGMVIEGIDRVSKIIRELLDFARDTKLSLTKTAIGELVSSVAREYGPTLVERGHRFEVEIDPDLPAVIVDPDKVRQVLLNLLSNAADACPQGGHIQLVATQGEGRVQLRAIDDGVGMSSEVLSRIFEPFYTNKDEGTGLGLYISRKLIEHQGGEIEVVSEVGAGTTFTIRLPIERRRGR